MSKSVTGMKWAELTWTVWRVGVEGEWRGGWGGRGGGGGGQGWRFPRIRSWIVLIQCQITFVFTLSSILTQTHCLKNSCTFNKPSPEGRPGMPDVTLLYGIIGLSFDSPFLSPLLFFFLSAYSSCSFYLVIFLLMFHSPDFSPRKLWNIFRWGLGLLSS